MKAILYITVLTALLASSCATGGRYVKSEFDDLYYLPSDRVEVVRSVASNNLPGGTTQEQYFDNIYSGDTLIAEQYNENVDFDNSLYYNKDYSPFEYMDDWSYSNRLRRFYGNYFYPYWRDPFYYSWNYSPWYYYDYFYNPYWGSLYDPFYYGMFPGTYYGFYGSYLGALYSPYSFYYSGLYSGYYWPTYRFYYRDDFSSAPEGRRERYSSMTSNYTSLSSRGRTTGYSSSSGSVASTSRRTESTLSSPRQSSSADSKTGQVVQTRRETTTVARTTDTRPEYSQVSRSYTPTYNNPRLSDRPSYNTSRVSTEAVQRNTARTGNVGVYRSNTDSYFNNVERRAPSSYSVGQTRTVTPSSVGDYSAPSMRSITRDASVSSSRRYESSSYSSGMSSGSLGSGSGGSSIGSSGGGGSSSGSSVSTGTRR